jgi:hypothetical protein
VRAHPFYGEYKQPVGLSHSIGFLLSGQRDGADKFQQVDDGNVRAHGVRLASARQQFAARVHDHRVAGGAQRRAAVPKTSEVTASAPPLATMRGYLDALDTASSGPPSTSTAPSRVLAALDPDMLKLAGERTWGANPLGMPVAYTANARAVLGPDALLAVTQFAVLDPDPSNSAALARAATAAALPNRRSLLNDLGFDDIDSLHDRLVDALVVRGTTDDIAHRVEEHLDAGADHVSLYVLTTTPRIPPVPQWRDLAGRLLV